MRARTLTLAATTGAVALVLAGCGPLATGPTTTEDRPVEADVTAVQLETSGSLVVEQGDTPGLTVTARESVLEDLTSEVRDGVLVLGVQPGVRWQSFGAVEYHLVLPSLETVAVLGSGDVEVDRADGDQLGLTIEGSGDVEVADVDVDSLSVSIAGSGDVTVRGQARSEQVSIEGSGGHDGEDLTSAEAVVSVQGSGDVLLAVSDSLDVSIQGSGSVTYAGDPRVTRDIQGSGDLVQASD